MPNVNLLSVSDPISAISSAVVAVSGDVQAELALDLELARHDADYRTLLIGERSARKKFWEPLQDLLMKIAEGVTLNED